jgi:predicted DNA-binding transcriptional regulator YafY
MARASESQKVERLNRARDLLRHVDQLSDAVEQLARACSISPRQAYRYLEQAQRLKEPVQPAGEAKLAFTVKLPHSLVRRVRTFAAAKGLSISEVVSRALLALLPRGRGRG